MPTIRFNHVFYALLFLSAMCAFVIPARITDGVRDNVKLLFYPVSWPIHALAGAMHPRERIVDDRAVADIRLENDALRVRLANVEGQLEVLAREEAERASLGDVRKLCQPSRVIANSSDIGRRQTLHIAATTMKGAEEGTPVLFAGTGGSGIAGMIQRAQPAGSMVQLITDPGFRVRVGFARLVAGADGSLDFVLLKTPVALAEGDGENGMIVRNLTWQAKEDADIKAGDWVVLRDEDWPTALQRYRLGRVESIARRVEGPGHADIRLAPPIKLANLREVMVMFGQHVNVSRS